MTRQIATAQVKRAVLAIDKNGAVRAIGPVYTDGAVEKLRDKIDEAGWENHGVVTLDSASTFRIEIQRRTGGTE